FAGEPKLESDWPGPVFTYSIATTLGRAYLGATGALLASEPGGPPQLRRRSEPLITSIAVGYHGAVIAASNTEALSALADDLDADLTLSAPVASVGIVVASPRSPYVVAGSEGVVLVWNLDDMLPRAVSTPRPVSMGIVGRNQLIVQSLEGDL